MPMKMALVITTAAKNKSKPRFRLRAQDSGLRGSSLLTPRVCSHRAVLGRAGNQQEGVEA